MGPLRGLTFDVVLCFAGGANPASVCSVQFHLADVGAHTCGQGTVGESRQLDVVEVVVPVGTDVSKCLMVAEADGGEFPVTFGMFQVSPRPTWNM